MNDSQKPNDVVGMEFIGLVDDRYLLVIVDFMSKRVQVDVCRKADGESVLRGSCC